MSFSQKNRDDDVTKMMMMTEYPLLCIFCRSYTQLYARRWAFSDRLWWWRWRPRCSRWWCRLHWWQLGGWWWQLGGWWWQLGGGWWQLGGGWWQLGGRWWRIAMADHPRQIEQQLLNQGRGRMIDCSHYNTSSSAHPILTSIIKVSLKIGSSFGGWAVKKNTLFIFSPLQLERLLSFVTNKHKTY